MNYCVVPFSPSMNTSDRSSNPVTQLQAVIDEQAKEGWEYATLEDIEFDELTPGSAGCFGIGARPTVVNTRRVYLVVFRK
jgi:hypothetical protein